MLEKSFRREATARSCFDMSQDRADEDVSLRLKTECNFSQFEKESNSEL